jgi:PAS domain S-box-containing protein
MHTVDYKALADNSIDTIVQCSLDGIATYVSPSIERLIGIRPEDLIGKSHRDYIVPEDMLVIGKTIAAHRSGQSDGVATFRMTRTDGHIVWVEALGRQVMDPITGGAHLVIILRDITAHKALEERLALLALTNEQTMTDDRGAADEDEHAGQAKPKGGHRNRPGRLVN